MASSWNPHHKDQTRKLEMVQRRAARYTTNRFRNTSSVSSMLAGESRSSSPFSTKWLTTWLTSLQPTTWFHRRAVLELHIQRDTDGSQHHPILLNLAFSPGLYLRGILYQPLLLRPLLWYLSRRGYPPCYSKRS